MEKWIIPCNVKYYDNEKAFSVLKILDWKQSNKSMQICQQAIFRNSIQMQNNQSSS